ncbi:integrase [Deinococcus sp. PEB2-67]
MPLMQIALRIKVGRAQGTVDQYVRHFLAFEGFLNAIHVSWDASPDLIRKAAFRYLKEHGSHVVLRQGRWHVYTNDSAKGLASQTLRLRFEALRTIYGEAIRAHLYTYEENPFAHTLSVQANSTAPTEPPTWSGLTTDHRTRREPEQFMLFETGYWTPKHLLDAANFPQLILKAFETASLRDQCVTRLMCYGGVRLNEGCSLNFAGWNCVIGGRPAFHHTFKMQNKGTGNILIKPVMTDEYTGTLLRRYFIDERPAYDPLTSEFTAWCQSENQAKFTPENYFAFLLATDRSPEAHPVFLNRSGQAYTASAYRKGAWRPRLTAAHIKARPHQLRHAFVTTIMDGIAEAFRDDPEQLDLARNALGAYMFWANPERTLRSYDHSLTDERKLQNIAHTLDQIRSAQSEPRSVAIDDWIDVNVERFEQRQKRIKGVRPE